MLRSSEEVVGCHAVVRFVEEVDDRYHDVVMTARQGDAAQPGAFRARRDLDRLDDPVGRGGHGFDGLHRRHLQAGSGASRLAPRSWAFTHFVAAWRSPARRTTRSSSVTMPTTAPRSSTGTRRTGWSANTN